MTFHLEASAARLQLLGMALQNEHRECAETLKELMSGLHVERRSSTRYQHLALERRRLAGLLVQLDAARRMRWSSERKLK